MVISCPYYLSTKSLNPGQTKCPSKVQPPIDPPIWQIYLSNKILPNRAQLAVYGSGYPMSIQPLNQNFNPRPNFQTTIFGLPINPPTWQIDVSNNILPDGA